MSHQVATKMPPPHQIPKAGVMIGAGIFALTGQVAELAREPSALGQELTSGSLLDMSALCQ
jgi:hypothetical protein